MAFPSVRSESAQAVFGMGSVDAREYNRPFNARSSPPSLRRARPAAPRIAAERLERTVQRYEKSAKKRANETGKAAGKAVNFATTKAKNKKRARR